MVVDLIKVHVHFVCNFVSWYLNWTWHKTKLTSDVHVIILICFNHYNTVSFRKTRQWIAMVNKRVVRRLGKRLERMWGGTCSPFCTWDYRGTSGQLRTLLRRQSAIRYANNVVKNPNTLKQKASILVSIAITVITLMSTVLRGAPVVLDDNDDSGNGVGSDIIKEECVCLRWWLRWQRWQ